LMRLMDALAGSAGKPAATQTEVNGAGLLRWVERVATSHAKDGRTAGPLVMPVPMAYLRLLVVAARFCPYFFLVVKIFSTLRHCV
jgi:hypothetical protein